MQLNSRDKRYLSRCSYLYYKNVFLFSVKKYNILRNQIHSVQSIQYKEFFFIKIEYITESFGSIQFRYVIRTMTQ